MTPSAEPSVVAFAAAFLLNQRGSDAEDRYQSLGPGTDTQVFRDELDEANRNYRWRNVAMSVGIVAALTAAGGAIWGILVEE